MRQRKIGGFISRLPKSVRVRIADWLLNWAEKQKKAKPKNWFVFHLQNHRDEQYEIAEMLSSHSQPPKGTEIEFEGFRLYEIFHYEDFAKIRSGLKKLFPDQNSLGSNFLERFEETSETMHSGVWHPIGVLSRDAKNYFMGGRSFRQFPTIHELIKSIDIEVQKILPSTFIVSFDVQLEDEATAILRELQTKKYLGDSAFNGITLGKFPLIDMVMFSPEDFRIEKIKEWISGIRENVEQIIKPYFSGYFLSKYSNTGHLPSIEVYSLKRSLADQKNFARWISSDRGWAHSLSLNLDAYNTFGNKDLVFSWHNSTLHSGFNDAHKIIYFSEKMSSRERSIWRDAKFLFIELTSISAVLEYLDDSQKAFEKMRRQIFGSMGKSYGISRYIKLYQTFQILSRPLQRLNLEIEHKMWFFGTKSFYDLSSLVALQFDKNAITKKKGDPKTLILSGKEKMEFLNKILIEHIAFIDKIFSTHIEFLNIDAVYRLQKQTFILTVIATLVAVAGILLNLPEIKEMLDKLFQAL